MFQFSIQFPSKHRHTPTRAKQTTRGWGVWQFTVVLVACVLLFAAHFLHLISDKTFFSGFGVIFSGVFLSIGFFTYVNDLRLMREARNTPTSRIRSAAQGYVELNGTLIQRDDAPLLQSPLTNTPCLWWSYSIEKKTSNGRRIGNSYHSTSEKWTTIDSGRSEQWLLLRDETGQCAINPAGASVTGHQSKSWRGNAPHPRDAPITGLRKLTAGEYRYYESVLLPDEPLYAIGEFRSHDGQHSLEAPHDQRPFALSGKGEAALVRSARTGAIVGGVFFLLGAMGLAGVVLWQFLG